MAQRLVVVYAKSGMGKSSLINAGLKELVWDGGVLPLPVRLNDREAGPLKTLYQGIDQAVVDRKVEHAPGSTATLWHYFKTAEFWRGDLLLTPLPSDKNCSDSEKRHPAPLSKGFWMMAHEVTVEQFRRFIDDARATMIGRWLLPRDVVMDGQPDWSRDNHPVVNVSWFDATAFCEFIGGRLPRPSGSTLPEGAVPTQSIPGETPIRRNGPEGAIARP
jgi:hypothetical protein